MNQFKQMIVKLPRHVSPNHVRVNSSGCQSDVLFRSRYGHISPRYPSIVQSVPFTEHPRSKINDDAAQAFLYGNPKLALFHNRNSSMDRPGNPDFSFQDVNRNNHDNKKKIARKTFKTEACKADKVQAKLATVTVTPRTYAQIIADYSEAIEEKKKSAKHKEPPRGFFSKIPFESVVTSLSRLDRNGRGKVCSSSNRQAKESNYALADNNAKTEKRKKSPLIKKDAQRRDYFTKNSEKTMKSAKSNDVTNNILESSASESKTSSNMMCSLVKDFDLICGNDEIENEKENYAIKWIRPKISNQRLKFAGCVTLPAANDSSVTKLKAEGRMVKKVNIRTLDGKIENERPRTTETANSLEMNSKHANLHLSTKMSMKTKGIMKPVPSDAYSRSKFYFAKASSPTVPKKASKGSENDKENKPKSTDKQKDAQDTKAKSPHNRKALPWWVSSECDSRQEPKKPGTCLNDVYSSKPDVKVLGSEDMASQKLETKKKPSKSIDPARATANSGQKARRRRKASSISKISRHIEEELAERKSEGKKKAATDSPADDDVNVPKAKKGEDEKEASKGAKSEDGKKSDKEPEGSPDEKKSAAAGAMDKKSGAVVQASSVNTEKPVLIEKVVLKKDAESKPNIAVLQKTIETITEKSKEAAKAGKEEKIAINSADAVIRVDSTKGRREGLIDYGLKVKKITEPLKPEKTEKTEKTEKKLADTVIRVGNAKGKKDDLSDHGLKAKKMTEVLKSLEKKKEGVLADSGLKVKKISETLKPDKTEKTENIEIKSTEIARVGSTKGKREDLSDYALKVKKISEALKSEKTEKIAKKPADAVIRVDSGKGKREGLIDYGLKVKNITQSLKPEKTEKTEKKPADTVIKVDSAKGKKEDLSDYGLKAKRMTEELKSFEKKKEGALADSGLKVKKISESQKPKKTEKTEKKPADTVIRVDSTKGKKEDLSEFGSKGKKISESLKPLEKKKDGTLIDYGLKVPTRKQRPKPTSRTILTAAEVVKEILPKKSISAPTQKTLSEADSRKSGIPLKISPRKPASQTKSEMPIPHLSTRVKPPTPIKEEPKTKAEDNLVIAADKSRGKGGTGTAPAQSDTGGPGPAPLKTSKKNEDEPNAADRNSDTLKFNEPVDSHGHMLKTLDLSVLTAEDGEHKNSFVRTKSCGTNDRPEKELIYSVWLNRFHTRQHQETIK